MATRLLLQIIIRCVPLAIDVNLARAQLPPRNVSSVDAAFNINDYTVALLVDDVAFMVEKAMSLENCQGLTFPFPAFSTEGHKTFIIYDDEYGFLQEVEIRKDAEVPQKRGPDAPARIGDKLYVFKGCQMAVGYRWNMWGQRGLPCDVDAAWNFYNKTVVLKGASCWSAEEDGLFHGPEPVSDFITLRSIAITVEGESANPSDEG